MAESNVDTRTVQQGDVVEVRYVGSLDTGVVFDTNVREVAEQHDLLKNEYPLLKFTVGSGQMISGFDQGVIGMKLGEKKTVTVPAEQAYGLYREDLTQMLFLSEFEKNFPDLPDLEEGTKLFYRTQEGGSGYLIVKSIGADYIILDFNHELAGKALIFDIELVSINPE
jgi:FKBP-type peptidyl-prolyl cis-trans isomerase 2